MDIYNTSVLQGVFPDQLKRSIVLPIPKVSPPQTIEDDLRPISLTAQVSKVMEGFMLQSLMSEVGLKLDPKQFALPGKSTTQALVYLLHLIHAALDQGHCSVRIFFADFKKGFDLVDHIVIIDELFKLQVSPAIIRWIKSFLTSREQCVKIGPSFSSWKPVNGGLPQGTKLGPLLFAILVNSLLQDWNGRIKFVDDATALEIVPRCYPSLLPILVNDVSQYASSRGMKLNSKKCKEMTISFLQYHLPLDNAIYIDGSPVQSVSSFKLLGVLLREDLSWCDHVDYVIKKANSRLYALRKLKKAGLSDKDLVTIYSSFIRSRIEYASPAWSTLTQGQSDLIESIQRRALRILLPEMSYQDALNYTGLRVDIIPVDDLYRENVSDEDRKKVAKEVIDDLLNLTNLDKMDKEQRENGIDPQNITIIARILQQIVHLNISDDNLNILGPASNILDIRNTKSWRNLT
ncbi:RNA-directed DNA polymerase from mobile element jockey, partial [Paramuricea clavata]